MRIKCRRTTNGLGSRKLSPARYRSNSRRPEDDRTFFRGDTGIDGTRRGCNVGVALRHDHARVLRNVCKRTYGSVRNNRGPDGTGVREEPKLRIEEPKCHVSEASSAGRGPEITNGRLSS